MERPSELFKPLANQLARSAVSGNATEIFRILRGTGLLPQVTNHDSRHKASGAADGPTRKSPDIDRIGIWERKLKSGKAHFARSMDKVGEWNYWANVGRIDAKGTKRRVIFTGESVARGYFYDPEFTPAMALHEIIRSWLGRDEIEVIDLARTSLDLDGLSDLAKNALVLEPDAIVIFAGNNWGLNFTSSPRILRTPEIQSEMSVVLSEYGVPGLRRYIEERLANQIRCLVNEIASLYEAHGIPVVWVVPEFNLADWRDPVTNAPHLPKGANREWFDHWMRALDALRKNDLDTVADSAGRMVELDQGVCVTGLYILAEYSLRLNNPDAARSYLEKARDALIWDPSRMVSPRAYSVGQNALRNEVSKLQNGLVDLPLIFRQYLNGELPDRRLFLDYCHLSSTGIRIAMAATASRLLERLKGIEVSWSALVNQITGPPSNIEGEAAFLAAIHNAHWWQSEELVTYYCSQSIHAAPQIAQVMTEFLDIQTRIAPMLMCESAERVAMLGSSLIQQYLLRHSRQYLDPMLLGAITSALGEIQIDARQNLDQLRQEEHSVTRKDVDLLNLYYCFSSDQPQELRWVLNDQVRTELENDYFQSYGVESRFVFIGKAGSPVRLGLTCRLPHHESAEGAISIEVNGERVKEIAIDGHWKSLDMTVAGGVVRNGVNNVVVRWPFPQFPGEKALEAAAQNILHGSYPGLFPVFGEIHRFVASNAL
jgi:hypothetical protein